MPWPAPFSRLCTPFVYEKSIALRYNCPVLNLTGSSMTQTDAANQVTGHTVEKIGGTSMAQFEAVRQNVFMNPALQGQFYHRIFVVSAYAGITNMLLEHKKTGQPGIYALFGDAEEQQKIGRA